jgi:ADP-heptose:LPS heptosyltransferase
MEGPRKLLLRNFQSPGDLVMLTAAVRDLHRSFPGRFITDVRTSCPEIWENNPHITALDENDSEVEVVECRYPLVGESNRLPVHFVQAFGHYLSSKLGVGIETTEFKGDIHLSYAEQKNPSITERWLGEDIPFWIVVSGGKSDFTVKWWESSRYQAVIDAFEGRILFVQVGREQDHHPRLRGTLDLRGKTTLRELIVLIHQAQGVLCPVTAAMHLAAAVPCRPNAASNRACVVVAGGREPPHWEAYPCHQFIHTVGSLHCCETGGCWKARVHTQGDGDALDSPQHICLDVTERSLPRCMDSITVEHVVTRIELYFKSELYSYLTPRQARSVALFPEFL